MDRRDLREWLSERLNRRNLRSVSSRLLEGIFAGIIASLIVSAVLLAPFSPVTQPNIQVSNHYEENGHYIVNLINSGDAPAKEITVTFRTERTDHNETTKLERVGQNQRYRLEFQPAPVRRNITDTRTNVTILNTGATIRACDAVSQSNSVQLNPPDIPGTPHENFTYHESGVVEYNGVDAFRIRRETYRRPIVEPTIHQILVQRQGENRAFIFESFDYPNSVQTTGSDVILEDYAPNTAIIWENQNGCIIDDKPLSELDQGTSTS